MKTSRELGSAASYAKLVLLLTAAGLLMLALGFTPTRRLAGAGAEGAMFAGVGISWFACVIAALPLVGMTDSPRPHLRLTLSMGLRLFFVVAFTGSILFSGWFDAAPLLIWVGASYFLLLMIDAGFAMLRLGGIYGGIHNATQTQQPQAPRS